MTLFQGLGLGAFGQLGVPAIVAASGRRVTGSLLSGWLFLGRRCGERLRMGFPHGHRKTTTLVAGLRMAALSNRSMKAICDRLNGTPRKCLGWRTPTEASRDEMMKLR